MHEYYQKLFLGFTHVFAYTNRFVLRCMTKKPFFQIFRLLHLKILPSQMIFSKKDLYLTFAGVNFQHHAIYHWKGLGEYIPNIYTFMGQKPFLFHIRTRTILTILVKNCLNSLSHEYYQTFLFGFACFYTHQSFPLEVYVKKSFSLVLATFHWQDIAVLDGFLANTIST